MEALRMILYLIVTIIVCPIMILPVVIVCTVCAGASGGFDVIRDKLRKRLAALQTKAARRTEEAVPGRARMAEKPVHSRVA